MKAHIIRPTYRSRTILVGNGGNLILYGLALDLFRQGYLSLIFFIIIICQIEFCLWNSEIKYLSVAYEEILN